MSGEQFVIQNEYQLEHMIKSLREKFEAHGYLVVKPSTSKPRTARQNNALHLYCSQLADELNERGLDMRKVLKPEIDIPWNKDSVKEHLWKPVQQVVIGKDSTANADTVDYTHVYDVVNRHLGNKFGVSVHWPCLEGRK